CPSYSTIPTITVIYFFTPPVTTKIYTLSLHDALPISQRPVTYRGQNFVNGLLFLAAVVLAVLIARNPAASWAPFLFPVIVFLSRSEEHTSELQSLRHLVCRLLLEKKKEAHTEQYLYRL